VPISSVKCCVHGIGIPSDPTSKSRSERKMAYE
jgi:hypothetical protein